MQNRKPMIGETVWYYPPSEDRIAHSNSNKGVIPAIVTRVWGEDQYCAVNLKIFPDHASTQDRGSVTSMYLTPATRSWCFMGDFELDGEGVPILDVQSTKDSSSKEDTINT